MNSKYTLFPLLFAIVLTATGCAMPPNAQEPPMGATVSLTMAQQVMNPTAGTNSDPVTGLDGQAAKSGYDAYQKTYRAPVPQQNVFTIGIGGGR